MKKQIFEIVTKSNFVVASAELESWQWATRWFNEYLEDNINLEYCSNFILDTKENEK